MTCDFSVARSQFVLLPSDTPVVTECAIYWVVNLVNATVSSGQLTEDVSKNQHLESTSDNPWVLENPGIYRAKYTMDLSDPPASDNLTTFELDNTTACKVYSIWSELAAITFNLPADDNTVKSGPVLKVLRWQDPPILLKVLTPNLPWDTPNNVTAHMAEIVTVINQVVRRNTLSARHRHDVSVGIAWIYLQFVEVHWPWITVPLALLLISGLFLAATIFRGSTTWKTWPLATLVGGLGDAEKSSFGSWKARE